MSFAGIILLVTVCIVIAALANGRRPGIVAGIAGLGAVGLLLIVLIYFWRDAAVPYQAPPSAVMWSDSNGAMPIGWQDDAFHAMTPNEMHAQWRRPAWSFVGLMLLAGVAVAVFTLLRRSGGACAVGGHRSWWPTALLLLFVPLGLFFLVGRTQVQRQASIAHHFDAEMHAQKIHERVARQQAELERKQLELAQRTGELNSELQHRIETMDIHKLMDLVDAPRIMLPMPTPATIAHWAQVVAEQQSGETIPAAGTNPNQPEAEVKAEADAAVALIAAEDESWSQDTSTASIGGAGASVRPSPTPLVTMHSDTDEGGQWNTATSAEREPSSSTGKSKDPRPAWVGATPKRVGNVRRDVIVTDEYATSEECEWAADRLLQLKTYAHLQRLVGNPFDADQSHRMQNYALSIEGQTPWYHAELENAGITIDYIHHEIARDEYMEEVERSFGKMRKLYTQIEFTPAVENELRQRWQVSQRQERFAFVGLGAGSVLGLLGLAWGLLKVDTWTKGYYTKRLFIGVPLAVIGTFGLYALLVEMGFDLPH